MEDDEFWQDIIPLELGPIPQLHDSVVAIGYPSGGDNLCITSGVVSRVDVTTYAHSNFRYVHPMMMFCSNFTLKFVSTPQILLNCYQILLN